jgi:cytosine/adenosine deaminase-related metal-dependent hydrolase
MSSRRALELGTIEGARSLGIDGRVGSLVPGKRADLILVSTGHVNMGVLTDPASLLVEAAEAANVDTVMVDGRVLKRGGRLVAVAVEQLVEDANAAFQGVRQRANWPAPDFRG